MLATERAYGQVASPLGSETILGEVQERRTEHVWKRESFAAPDTACEPPVDGGGVKKRPVGVDEATSGKHRSDSQVRMLNEGKDQDGIFVNAVSPCQLASARC